MPYILYLGARTPPAAGPLRGTLAPKGASQPSGRRGYFHLIPAEQLRVVAEIAQRPAELPQGLGRAIESAGEGAPSYRLRFDNGEPNDVKRLLALPRVPDLIDSDQEHAIGNFGVGLCR